MRARKAALTIALLAVSGLVFFLPQGATAQVLPVQYPLDVTNAVALHLSTIECGIVGGSWSNSTGTCTVSGSGGVAAASTLDVDKGANLVIASGASFTLSGYLFSNAGTVTNAGTMTINPGGGQYSSSPGSSFTNTGTITNGNGNTASYAYIFASGGTFTNKGTINNMRGGSIQDLDSSGSPGVLTNAGTINNFSFLQLYSGQHETFSGPEGFSGTFVNTGTLNMNPGSTLTVGYAGQSPTVLEITAGTLSMPTGVTLYVSGSGSVKVDPTASIAISGFLTAQAGPDSAKDPGGVVNNAGTITVSSGGVMTIGANASAPVTNNSPLGATVTNSGTLSISTGATVNNMFGGNLMNSGVVNNAGTLTTNGVVTNQPLGVITNSAGATFSFTGVGVLNNTASATVNNSGLMITKSGGSTISSAGTINNNSGGNFTLNDVVQNTGTFVNNFHAVLTIGKSGNFYDNAGGTLTNQAGTITNMGSLLVLKGATVNVNGVGSITSTDYILNAGAFNVNSGGATLTSSGTILNQAAGTFTINDVLTNSGIFNNTGTVTTGANANLYDTAGSTLSNSLTFSNSGDLWVGKGATVTNSAGGSFTNGGVIINHGTVTNSNSFSNSGAISNCGGTVNATPAISGNPVQDICPVTDTKTAPVSSGAVIAEAFTDTGVTVAISGTTGQNADIFTAKYSSQPPGTGTDAMTASGGAGGSVQFYDVAVSGVVGGTAQVCITSPSVSSSSSIAYYSNGTWSLATGVAATAGTKVCGNLQVSALVATPISMGNPAASLTTSSTSVSTTLTTSSTVPEFPPAALIPLLIACMVALSLLSRKSNPPRLNS